MIGNINLLTAFLNYLQLKYVHSIYFLFIKLSNNILPWMDKII